MAIIESKYLSGIRFLTGDLGESTSVVVYHTILVREHMSTVRYCTNLVRERMSAVRDHTNLVRERMSAVVYHTILVREHMSTVRYCTNLVGERMSVVCYCTNLVREHRVPRIAFAVKKMANKIHPTPSNVFLYYPIDYICTLINRVLS